MARARRPSDVRPPWQAVCGSFEGLAELAGTPQGPIEDGLHCHADFLHKDPWKFVPGSLGSVN